MKTQKPRTRGVSRARMFIKAHLYWLNGYPISGMPNGATAIPTWQPAPRRGELTPEPLQLTREHLHRASRTFTRLVNRFPHALPKAVDNYDLWVERVPQLIDLCKEPVHDGTPFPTSLLDVDRAYPDQVVRKAQALMQRQPLLKPLVGAASWATFLTPDALSPLLAWIDEHHSQLHHLLANLPHTLHPINFPLTLWSLSQADGSQRVEPLLEMLGNPRTYTQVTEVGGAYLDNFIEALRPKKHKHNRSRSQQLIQMEAPAPTLGKDTFAFAEWVIQQPAKTRCDALDLFDLLFSVEILDDWMVWWQQTNELLRQSKSQINIHVTRTDKATMHFYRKEGKILANKIDEHRKLAPTGNQPNDLFTLIADLSKSEHAPLRQAILGVLPHIPQRGRGRFYRADFIQLLLKNSQYYWRERHLYFVPILGKFLAGKDVTEPFLNRWFNASSNNRYFYNISDDLTEQAILSALEAYYRACHEPITHDSEKCDFSNFIELAKFSDEADEISTVFRLYVENNLPENNGSYFDAEILTYVVKIDPDRKQMVELIKIIDVLEYKEHECIKILTDVGQELSDAGWTELVKNQLLDNRSDELIAVGKLIRSIESTHGRIPEIPTRNQIKTMKEPVWFTHVPQELHPILLQFDALFADAEEIAERVLGKAFPSPDRLREEIAGIESQIDSIRKQSENAEIPQRIEHLNKRLNNLTQRLHAPKPLAANRIDKLRLKLERTFERMLLQRWRADLQNELHRQITQLLGIIEVPQWLLQQQQLALLGPIAQLSPKMRALALDLLRLRSGPPPWSLNHHHANQAYLHQLRKRGINPEPWINTTVPHMITGENDRQVVLAFADDPLDIFQMGSHFKTCLSVDDFNFFSVFANAADINKRVLYAYDAEGYEAASTADLSNASAPYSVIGRCLFSLTDRGEILIFHPYCHDRELGFEKLVLAFASELAQQMNTKIVAQGKVPTLVADQWYDDGPVDLVGVMACFQSGSPFRQALPSMEPADLLPRLKQELATEHIDSLTLVRLINLNEIEQRAELVLPLLPLFESLSSGLPPWNESQMLTLAYKAGAKEFVYRYYRHKGVSELIRLCRYDEHLGYQIWNIMVEFEPSLALRLLRQTRHIRIRSDEEEFYPRNGYIVRAYKALNRPQRAERLQEIYDAPSSLHDFC